MFVQRLDIASDGLALLPRNLVRARLIAGGKERLQPRQRCKTDANLRNQPMIGSDVGQAVFEITRRLALGTGLAAENISGEIVDASDRVFENFGRAIDDCLEQFQKQRRAAAHLMRRAGDGGNEKVE